MWGGLTALVLAGVIIAVGQWLGRDGVVVLLSVLTALFGILVTIRAVFGDDHDSRPQANHHRYLLPADFDTHGRDLLLRVQRTRHLLEKASKVLGGCFRQRAGDDAAA